MMRTVGTLLLLTLAAGPGSADTPAQAPSVGQTDAVTAAEARSRQQLDASLAELTRLREQVATEKLPLVRRLGELEERLSKLRKDNDSAIRGIDTGGFDASKLDAAVKLRADEATYVSTLLDEYVRNFESKLNVGESERYAPIVRAAKDAATSPSLTRDQQIESQLSAVHASIARLDDVMGGTRFAGSAVDPNGVLAPGNFALVGPVAMFASNDGSAAGIAVPQAGSVNPAVRPVSEQVTADVSGIVRDGSGAMPFDASRGGALEELIERTSIVHIFKKGGPIMWPLLFVSLLASATVMERMVFLVRERSRRDPKAMSRFLAAVDHGRFEEAAEIGRTNNDFIVRALGYALSHREKSLASALFYATSRELKRFTRGVSVLDTSITIAPLLGLLGTVTGMMGSFSLIGGDLSAPAAITGGIAEALIATAFGLLIAIVALVPFNFLNSRTEEARHELDAAATQLELLAKPWLEAAERPSLVSTSPSHIPTVHGTASTVHSAA